MKLTDPVPEKFGLTVKKLRISQGLTQERLAEESGLDRTYISDIERGIRNPGIKNIVKIANALETSAAQLFRAAGL